MNLTQDKVKSANYFKRSKSNMTNDNKNHKDQQVKQWTSIYFKINYNK